MLDKVELLVAGCRPEVAADYGCRLTLGLTFFTDHEHAGLLAERGIGEHYIETPAWIRAQAVVGPYRQTAFVDCGGADALQERAHRTKPCDAIDDLDTGQSLKL